MKLAYPVATPETADAGMLAIRGPLGQKPCVALVKPATRGVELMLRDAALLNAQDIARLAGDNGLRVGAVSTGQLRKEDGLSLANLDSAARAAAVDGTRAVIDLAAVFGAQVKVGTLRGHLRSGDRQAATESLARVLEHGAKAGVTVTIEPQCRFVIDWLNTSAEMLAYFQQFEAYRPALMRSTFISFGGRPGPRGSRLRVVWGSPSACPRRFRARRAEARRAG